jgi:hypothetical protein
VTRTEPAYVRKSGTEVLSPDSVALTSTQVGSRFRKDRWRWSRVEVIAGISNFADVGDTTTLANPEIVDDIRHHVQSEKVTRGDVPRELSPHEIEEIKAFGHAD